MFNELGHTRITGNHLQQETDFTANWNRPNSNVNQAISNMAHICMTEGERWTSDLLNHLNNKYPSSIANPEVLTDQKIYGLQNLNQLERWNVNQPNISHGLISDHSTPLDSLISRGFNNSNSSVNMDYNCYNSASVNVSRSKVFGGPSFEGYDQNVYRTNVSCDGMSFISPVDVRQTDLEFITSSEPKSSMVAYPYEDAVFDSEALNGRAALPGSCLQSFSGPSTEYFYQHQGRYGSCIGEQQIAYNMNIPKQSFYSNSNSLRQNYKHNPAAHILPSNYNTHQSTCGTSSQFHVQMSAPNELHHLTHQLPLQLDDRLKDQSNALCSTSNVFMESRKRKYDLVEPADNESWSTGTLADILPPNYLNYSVGDQFAQEFSASMRQHDLSFKLPRLEQWPETSVHEHFSEVTMDLLTTASDLNIDPTVTEYAMGNIQRKRIDVSCHEQKSEVSKGNRITTNDVVEEPSELSSHGANLYFEIKNNIEKEESNLVGPIVKCEFNTTSDIYDLELESMQSVTPRVALVECKGSGLGSRNIKTLSASDYSSTASQIEDPISSFIQHEEIIGNTTPQRCSIDNCYEGKNSNEKEEANQVGPKVKCEFNSASDVYDLELEFTQSVTPSASSVDSKGSGLGSRNIKTPNASSDSFTASQIKDHLSSFRQLKEVSGNTTPSDIQNTCQLCSMDKLLLAPSPIYCASCGSRIKQNVGYYRSADEDSTQHCFCIRCFKGCHGASILVCGGGSVSKTNLQKARNDEESEDSWVLCDKCQRWQHRICGLYNDERDAEGKEDYTCPRCCLQEIEVGKCVLLPQTALFEAKDLPRTNLSDHIEQRLFMRMKQEREETAKVLGIELGKVPEAEGLVVRVVSSVDKQLKVNQQFREIINGEYYPEEFPYKSKMIFLFQRLGGLDVCLFGMCVQEYGSECDGPNNRCVYISYVDSVKYFKPERNTGSGESLRTFVYHEILIGYLDYCKKRGFATCYIWACPLIKGEDYIFYCHPDSQKNPKQDKLRQWYKSMLRKATDDDIVVEHTNLYNKFFVPTKLGNSKITAARLPYFDGDYWSADAESIIKKLKKEESSLGPRSKLPTKRTSKAMGQYYVNAVTNDVLVMQKLGENILPLKENFMVAHLQYECTHCHKAILSGSRWFCNKCDKIQLCSRCYDAGKLLTRRRIHTCHSGVKRRLSEVVLDYVPLDTNNEDDFLVNKFFETRDDFLDKCQKSQYQFDTIGNAKYSSMKILYHLMQKLIGKRRCGLCSNHVLVDQCWRYDTCLKHYVCESCYELTHPSAKDVSKTKSKQPKKKCGLKTALDALIHASQCKSIRCSYPNCESVRKLLQHLSECSVTASNGCRTCQRGRLLLKEHAQFCSDVICIIPRCMDIRNCRPTVESISEDK